MDIELPEDVIAELEAGRKIEAIKRLRAHEGIDLIAAKEAVEAYLREHPASPARTVPQTDTGIGRIIILVIGVGVIFAIYKYFS